MATCTVATNAGWQTPLPTCPLWIQLPIFLLLTPSSPLAPTTNTISKSDQRSTSALRVTKSLKRRISLSLCSSGRRSDQDKGILLQPVHGPDVRNPPKTASNYLSLIPSRTTLPRSSIALSVLTFVGRALDFQQLTPFCT